MHKSHYMLRKRCDKSSSFFFPTTYPRSSVMSTLAGPSGRRPPACGGHRAVPGSGGPPGLRATHAAWRRWWHLQMSGSATRAASTLAYSNPSPSSQSSAMVRMGRRGLILTKPKKMRHGAHEAENKPHI